MYTIKAFVYAALLLFAFVLPAPVPGAEMNPEEEKNMETGWSAFSSRIDALDGEQKEIALCIRRLIEVNTIDKPGPRNEAMASLGYRDGLSLADMVRPDGGLYQTVAALFGRDYAEIVKRRWERHPDYPFPIQYSKEWVIEPSILHVRSRETTRHFKACLKSLESTCRAAVTQDAAAYIAAAKNDPDKHDPQLIGLILDEYDADGALFEKMKADILALGPDAANAERCGALSAGLLASHKTEAGKFLRDKVLLNFDVPPKWVPPALFRQLVPRIPGGTVENQIEASGPMGMGIWQPWEITEICGWFDLDPRRIHPENWGRIDEVITSELTDRKRDKRPFTGPVNHFATYIALWAESQYAVEDAAAMARWIVENVDESGEHEMKATALYFATRLDKAHWRLKIARPVFARPALRKDPTLLALAVACALRDLRGVRIVDEPVDNIREDDITALTLRERDELFDSLIATAQEMIDSGGGVRLGSFGWLNVNREPVGCTLTDVVRLMALLTTRRPIPPESDSMGANADLTVNPGADWGFNVERIATTYDFRIIQSLDGQSSEETISNQPGVNDDDGPEVNRLREKLCSLLPHLDAASARFVLRYAVQGGSGGPAQRNALVDSFRQTPSQAWLYSRRTDFTSEENARLESILADRASDKENTFILLKLLQQTPDALAAAILRLAASPNPRQYCAGFQLLGFLSHRAKEPAYREAYSRCIKETASGPNAAALEEYMEAVRLASLGDLGLCPPDAPERAYPVDPQLADQTRAHRNPVWLDERRKNAKEDDAKFADLIRTLCGLAFEPWNEGIMYPFSAAELVRAWRLGVLPEKDYIRLVVALGRYGGQLRQFTDPKWRRENLADLPELRNIVDRIVDRLAYIETRRGDTPMRTSEHILSLRRLDGLKYLADIYTHLQPDYGMDPAFRLSSAAGGRLGSLRRLASICQPLPGETAADLRRALPRDIPPGVFQDIANIAPQWKEMLGEGKE